ncbi:MAG: hypothetical protein ACTH0B_06590, partial [Senegalia sp. (in: firmicutes)]
VHEAMKIDINKTNIIDIIFLFLMKNSSLIISYPIILKLKERSFARLRMTKYCNVFLKIKVMQLRCLLKDYNDFLWC